MPSLYNQTLLLSGSYSDCSDCSPSSQHESAVNLVISARSPSITLSLWVSSFLVTSSSRSNRIICRLWRETFFCKVRTCKYPLVRSRWKSIGPERMEISFVLQTVSFVRLTRRSMDGVVILWISLRPLFMLDHVHSANFLNIESWSLSFYVCSDWAYSIRSMRSLKTFKWRQS